MADDGNNPKEIVLRDYQSECIEAIERAGDGAHLVVMATGLGKTVTFAHLPRHGRMLVLSHRDELVFQPRKYFDCSFGVEKAEQRSDGEEVVSASVQTLNNANRLNQFRPGDFDIVITDEAHHAVAPSYMKIIDHLKPRVHIGFTATPNRDDGRGLNKAFNDIIFERDLKWGIKNKYLSDIDCRRVTVSWNTKRLHSRGGDFALNELDAEVNNPTANEQVAKAYEELAIGQTLIFASSVKHAYALSEYIPGSYVVDGKTPLEERREIIQAFSNREIPALINFGVFTEGTDLPLIETILLARPTKNQALYSQMVGRGVRVCEGKEFLRLIDCVGLSNSSKLCTAPNLFGINEDELTDDAKSVIDGRILDLEDRISWADNTPKGWVIRDRKVDVLDGDDTLVAWTILPGNKRFVSGVGWQVELNGPDAVGEYKAIYRGSKGTTERTYKTLEEADNRVFLWLTNNPNAGGNSQFIWAREKTETWNNKPASGKQLKFLREILTNEEYESVTALRPNRHECAIIIEMKQREQELLSIEALGACPVCGRGLRPSTTGKRWMCRSNHFSKKENGEWVRDAGCGFILNPMYKGRKVPKKVLKDLLENKTARYNNQQIRIAHGDDSYYISG